MDNKKLRKQKMTAIWRSVADYGFPDIGVLVLVMVTFPSGSQGFYADRCFELDNGSLSWIVFDRADVIAWADFAEIEMEDDNENG